LFSFILFDTFGNVEDFLEQTISAPTTRGTVVKFEKRLEARRHSANGPRTLVINAVSNNFIQLYHSQVVIMTT
jgi:hypothetical protein